MVETVFTGEVTGYGSYDNDPPGFDIAYPNSRHPQTGTGTTSTCWGTAFGDGSWEYPLAMAGDVNRHPAGTVAYDEVSKKYYEMVDFCAACQAPANPRLDLYVGGDLNPTTTKVNQVDQASSNLTRIPGETTVGRRLILNPDPGKPVVLGPYSGISSGCGNVGPARTGGTTSPPPAPPPTTGGTGTVRTIASFGYAYKDNGPGTGIAFGSATLPRHAGADGLGTYANPITVAVASSLRTGGLAIGSRIYIDKVTHADGSVFQVDRYGVVEDDAGANIGIWVGGTASTSTTAQANADAAVTGTATIYTGVNDQWPVPVQGAIVQQVGGTSPPPAPPPAPPPSPPPAPPPSPPPTGGTGTLTSRRSFGYSSLDGTGIAFGSSTPPRHPSAGGVGTFTNPTTLAVTSALRTGGLAVGARVYIDTVTHTDGSVFNVKRYFVVEDDGAPDVGIYVGVTSSSTAANAANAAVSGTARVYTAVNDQWPVPVQGDIVAQVSGTSPPPAPPPSPPPAPPPSPPPAPPPSGQVITVSANNGTFQPAAGSANQYYWFANETWCVGNLRNGTDFTMAADIPTGSFPAGTNIRWSLPNRSADCGVWGYMTIQYGTEDGGNWQPPTGRTPFQPMQIKNAQQITTQFNVTRGGTGSYDVLGEIWLTNSPNSGPAIEVGVFFHDPNNGIATASDAISYQAASGQRVFVISRQGGSNTPFYCIGFQNSLNSGTFDWKELFNFLTQQGWVSGNEYFSGIDFGVEPFQGGGTLKVNSLVQTVR